MKVLAISGSLRVGSWNGLVLQAARELVDGDVEFELYDGLRDVPPYDEDDDVEPAPAAVARFREAIAGADAILFATPEYNSSVPGQLKNALDWASRPLATNVARNKPVAVVGASKGAFGAVWAQAELRKVLSAMGARVVEGEAAFGHAHEKFDADGRLVDEQLAEQLREVVDSLVEAARQRAEKLAAQAA
jgi:chromate reductase